MQPIDPAKNSEAALQPLSLLERGQGEGVCPLVPEAITHALGSPQIFAAVCAVAFACGAIVIAQRPQPCDDAYITFRHVRNLVDHGRPAWNLTGQPVLGSTSPAFMFVLMLPGMIFGSGQLPWISLAANGAFNALIVIFSFLILRDFGCGVLASLLGAFVIGINSTNVIIFSQGFEAAMLVATILIAIYTARVGALRTAVFVSSIAPLVRPEGVLVCVMVWTSILLRRHFQYRLIAVFLIMPALWALFATVYYGSPIPHSLRAISRFSAIYFPYNATQLGLIDRLTSLIPNAWHLWRDPMASLLANGVWQDPAPDALSYIRTYLVGIGAVISLFFAWRRGEGRLLYVTYPPLFLLLFAFLAHTKPWYYPSVVALELLAVIAGLFIAIETVCARLSAAYRRSLARLGVFTISLIAVFMASANQYSINRGEYDYEGKGPLFARHPFGKLWELWEDQRYYQYRTVAEFLNPRSQTTTTALITEVGIFGYRYEGNVLDSVGLCSPESLQFYPPPPDEIWRPDGRLYSKAETMVPTRLIMTLLPEYVVDSRTYLAHLFRDESPFLERYIQIAEFGKVWGEPLQVFARRDLVIDRTH